MNVQLFSLRMRAERAGGHFCGAERIAPADELPALAAALVERALAAGGLLPDAVHCRIDRLPGEIPAWPLPEVRTYDVADWQAGRDCAHALLRRAGVSSDAAKAAMAQLTIGPAPGRKVMRGAMIVDSLTGARLEIDPARGVRVSRMDLAPEARSGILGALSSSGLGHYRVAEALVLAGKVLRAPGLVAELCWSDDPEYEAGYVAAPADGYQRITRLKAAGDGYGGRAFFVRTAGWDQAAFVDYLERQAVLFDAVGAIAPPLPWES